MLHRLKTDPYAQAAVAYLAYGMVYLGGAIARLTPERKVTFFGFVPWWAFYAAGGLVMIVLPVLVWRRWKWLTRILGFLPAIKALTLVWRQARLFGQDLPMSPFDWLFAAVAVLASYLLLRAGWGDRGGGSAE